MTENFVLRKDGESEFDWLIRLVVAKIEKEHDLDWIEIRDLIGLECHQDTLRKESMGMYKYHIHMQNKQQDSLDADILKQFEDKRIEAQKEKFLLQDQRREYNRLIREQARFEHLRNEIIKSVHDLAKQKPLVWDNKEIDYNNLHRESLVLFSDWHKGLFANNYWNHFDNNEFIRRVKRLTQKTIEYSKLHGVQTLHTFLLGDLVNGYLHVTSRINATEDVVTQTKSVAETLAEVLCKFANEFEQIKVYHTRGNHDRLTPNKSDEIAKESLSDLVLWYLQARLEHITNIQFVTNTYDDEIIDADVCGQKIFAVHGHRDRPNEVIKNLSLMTKVVPDMVCMGHYHHHEEDEQHGIELVINNSLSGVDCYAKEIRKTGKPAQKLLIFDHHEKRLATYNIRLDI